MPSIYHQMIFKTVDSGLANHTATIEEVTPGLSERIRVRKAMVTKHSAQIFGIQLKEKDFQRIATLAKTLRNIWFTHITMEGNAVAYSLAKDSVSRSDDLVAWF